MAATLVFAMNNPNSTCTAAALTWCYMKLSGLTTPKAEHFLPSDPTMKRNMANVETLDADPTTQVALMGFEVVKKVLNSSKTSTEIAEVFKNTTPHVGIFWNSFHTVAYAYGHLDKQYFDNNDGLWQAKKTADIVRKMEDIRRAGSYGVWQGYVVLKLRPRLRIG